MKYRFIATLAVVLSAAGHAIRTGPGGHLARHSRPAGSAPLRIVFKIAKGPDGKFTGQAFSIDQGAPADSDEYDLRRRAHREVEDRPDQRQLRRNLRA